MNFQQILKVISLLLILASCKSSTMSNVPEQTVNIRFHQVTAKEVIDSDNHTLLLVEEDGREYWLCASQVPAKIGDQFLYNESDAELKTNHACQAQNKQLDSVIMVKKLVLKKSNNAVEENGMLDESNEETQMPANHASGRVIPNKINEQVKPTNESLTIEEIYSQKALLNGKKVKVKGKVVKVNPQIMDRNWVHIQDGTSFSGEFDLTVTTQQLVTVGNVVILEGVIAIDKDFTSGYFYPVIMEDAVVVP